MINTESDMALLADTTTLAPPRGPLAAAPPRASRRSAVLPWLLLAALFLVPVLIYAPTTFHDYGLRDDYSNLREAHEEPGKILKFCASHARPLYGLLLQASYGSVSSVQNLQWMRFAAALLLGVLAVVTLRALRAMGWDRNVALCFALLVVLAPSSQVVAAWAIGWPYALTALVGFAAFFVADGAFRPGASRPQRIARWLAALAMMATAGLMYQPSSLFYVVPLAASLVANRTRGLRQTFIWAAMHAALVVVALALAYGLMSLMYSYGLFIRSGRIAFEQQWLDKLGWFVREPIANALSLFVLNDNNHHEQWLYLAGASLAAALLVAGVIVEWRRHGPGRGIAWLAGLVTLPPLAFIVSLVASERYATYRTILALTAVLLVFLVASADALTAGLGRRVRTALAGTVIAVALACAQHHPYALIAVTQGNEWNLIMNGAEQVRLGDAKVHVFVVPSTPSDRSTESIYHDEFGSLSTNSEWVPKEMFKRAMHDLWPDRPNIESRYDFTWGPRMPTRHYDVVIDLHRLRRFYTSN